MCVGIPFISWTFPAHAPGEAPVPGSQTSSRHNSSIIIAPFKSPVHSLGVHRGLGSAPIILSLGDFHRILHTRTTHNTISALKVYIRSILLTTSLCSPLYYETDPCRGLRRRSQPSLFGHDQAGTRCRCRTKEERPLDSCSQGRLRAADVGSPAFFAREVQDGIRRRQAGYACR